MSASQVCARRPKFDWAENILTDPDIIDSGFTKYDNCQFEMHAVTPVQWSSLRYCLTGP